MAFAAEKRGNTVALAWHTASELNSTRFDVECSADGVAFAKIGEVAAAGSSSSTAHSYAFFNAQPGTGAAPAGTYALVATVNGCASPPSNPMAVVLAAKASQTPALALYPNPARNFIQLERPTAGTATVELLDAVGRRQWSGQAAGTRLTIPVREVPAGWYLVRVLTPDGTVTTAQVVVEH